MIHTTSMILRQNTSSRPNGTPPVAAASAVPAWLRRAVSGIQAPAGQGLEEVALVAGAALAALDAVVRGDQKWAGVWRHRLALAAAAVAAKQAGRIEAALRDAVLLTRPGDDAGPGGRMLLGWRRLAGTPAEKLLTEASIGAALDDFGLARDDEGMSDLTADLRRLATSGGAVARMTGAIASVERCG